MADPNSTFTEVTAVVNDAFMGKLRDAIFNSTALLRELNKRKKTLNGGRYIREDILFNNTADGPYGMYEPLPMDHVTDITAAQFDWKRYQQSLVLEEFDRLVAAGPTSILDFVASKMKATELKLKHSISSGVFSDGTTNTKHIDGLRMICAITGTYGGIAKGTYSWWQGHRDSTTSALSIKSMTAMFRDCTVDEDSPDMLVTGDDTLDVYENLLDPGQRYVNTDTANAGFRSLTFKGRPIVSDSHCPTTTTIPDIFFLNFDYLQLVVHGKRDMKFRGFESPIDQDAVVGRILFMGNIVCGNPRMQGWMSALAS
jgi:hypothetical protein